MQNDQDYGYVDDFDLIIKPMHGRYCTLTAQGYAELLKYNLELYLTCGG